MRSSRKGASAGQRNRCCKQSVNIESMRLLTSTSEVFGFNDRSAARSACSRDFGETASDVLTSETKSFREDTLTLHAFRTHNVCEAFCSWYQTHRGVSSISRIPNNLAMKLKVWFDYARVANRINQWSGCAYWITASAAVSKGGVEPCHPA